MGSVVDVAHRLLQGLRCPIARGVAHEEGEGDVIRIVVARTRVGDTEGVE